MLGHIGLNVYDLLLCRGIYDELMPLLGFETWFGDDSQVAYRPAGGRPGTHIFLYWAREDGDYSRHRIGLQHLAFMVPTRSRVREVHDYVVQMERFFAVITPPREFPEYPPPYYATFFEDRDNGFMLEAVCHKDAG